MHRLRCSGTFGFRIEFLENKDIGIFGHFMVIDFYNAV